ncbi:MAG TPA: acyl-CoA desaturase [Candidatus Xenobia bacterium]
MHHNFFAGLRAEVQQYFTDHHLPMQGPASLYRKTAAIFLAWLACYAVLLCLGPGRMEVAVLATTGLAIFTVAMQLGIMHDVSHDAFSNRRLLNTCMNFTLTMVGGSSILWHHKHVVRHHGHTNVPDVDDDIDTEGMFRFRAADRWQPAYRFQHVYAWLLYAGLCLQWFWYSDPRKVFNNLYRLRGRQLAWLWVELVVSKISNVMIFLVAPVICFQSVWVGLAVYLWHWLLVGFALTVIFQLAHIGPMQLFPERRTSDWALHQLCTTADYGVNDPVLTWLVGGLNFQVEHHIFPRMSHTHYPAVQRIVKSYCQRNGVAYHEYPSFWSALATHYRHLQELSRPNEEIEAVAA